jgi:hypothetical protein
VRMGATDADRGRLFLMEAKCMLLSPSVQATSPQIARGSLKWTELCVQACLQAG